MSRETHTVNSFEELFRSNYSKLCHFAMQFLNDNDAAKDIVQESFVTYWNLRERLSDAPEAIVSFLYSSVRNACLNKLRRQKLELGYLNQQELDPAEDAVALNAMIRSEVLSELNKVITTLPESCQRIFRMGYLEGLKNPQIAEELGISINTVKTQKKRGLELLKLRLNPDFFALLSLFLIK
ncbi:RNA polymerase sigma-70 factor [Pedobacter sp. GR22-6]|uniref:RNA polymerase sigma-70 factor n=1 Tax=Pedobacter sp. GR22-6 TaxID=3127957 RepID=UPI00307CF7BA